MLVVDKFGIMKYFVFNLRLTLTMTFISGQPILDIVYVHTVCKIVYFGTLVKITLIKNNDIYIFAHVSHYEFMQMI